MLKSKPWLAEEVIMRREDKRRMPPRLKLKLPPGYHLECGPDQYMLFADRDVHHGQLSVLVRTFEVNASPEEIKSAAGAHQW